MSNPAWVNETLCEFLFVASTNKGIHQVCSRSPTGGYGFAGPVRSTQHAARRHGAQHAHARRRSGARSSPEPGPARRANTQLRFDARV
eukprot:4758202-Pyramimonas_sp.AAC.1